MVTRRASLVAIATGLAVMASLPATAQDLHELRIGYQKNGVLAIARQQQVLDARLAADGIAVKWVEFPYGPPLLEALNVGSIDFGTTGDSPPIFAQAARANLLYVAASPAAGSGAAILLPKGSPIQSLADLKGKRVAFAKASSAHNFTIAALEKAGLTYADITPTYLPPADARAAFEQGAVDAWTIWDPYFAIAEQGDGVRILTLAKDVLPQNSFYLANRDFTLANPEVIRTVVDELAKLAAWAESHRAEVAPILAEITGVELAATERSVERADYVVAWVTEREVAEQQKIADRFHALGLIPEPITVRDIVWTPEGKS